MSRGKDQQPDVGLHKIMALVAVPSPDGLVGDAKKVVMRDLTAEQRRLVVDARKAEMSQMKGYGVFAPITREEANAKGHKHALSSKFIYEWKIIDGKVGIKARLVAEGLKKLDKRVGVDVVTGMPPARALLMLFAWIVRQPGYTPAAVMSADVKNAFLQSPMETPVLIRKPRDLQHEEMLDLFSKDGLALAKQALYGTREAPRC